MSDISFSKDFNRLLQELLSSLVSTIPNAETGSLQILDGDYIHFRATVGFDLEKLKECVFDAESDLYLLTKPEKPNIIKNLMEWGEKNLSKKQMTILREHGRVESIKAIIKISLVVNDKIWGFLNIENHEDENAFTKQDVEIAKAFKEIAENLIKIKLKNKELLDKYFSLSENLNKTYTLYDNYNHDLRNLFQLFLLILGLETSEEKKNQKIDIQDNLNKIENVMQDLLRYKPSSNPFNIVNAEILTDKVSRLLNEKFDYIKGYQLKIGRIINEGEGELKVESQTKIEKAIKNKNRIIKESFPLLDSRINITLFEDQNYHESQPINNDFFTEKQVLLQFQIELQISLLDYLIEKVRDARKQYRELLNVYRELIFPFMESIEKITIQNNKFIDKWNQAIEKSNTILDAISDLINY